MLVTGMGRRKGELSPNRVDREYPHQIALTQAANGGANYETVHAFAQTLSFAPRGHSFVRDDVWYVVFCFREKADTETFHARFGGEWFDRATRGRGSRWHLLREPKKRYY